MAGFIVAGSIAAESVFVSSISAMSIVREPF